MTQRQLNIPFLADLGVLCNYMEGGRSEIELDLQKRHENSWDMAHGGVPRPQAHHTPFPLSLPQSIPLASSLPGSRARSLPSPPLPHTCFSIAAYSLSLLPLLR